MSDRIEPIRRTEVSVTSVQRVQPRGRRRDDEPPRERPRREREPAAPVQRDDDGTPHVDVQA